MEAFLLRPPPPPGEGEVYTDPPTLDAGDLRGDCWAGSVGQ